MLARGLFRSGSRYGNVRALTGRRLVESRARRIARNWRRRRSLLVRQLDGPAVDALRAWSEARARLEMADDRGAVGERWTVAAQNSEARLLGRLEAAVANVHELSPQEHLRRLMEEQQ